MGDPIVLLKAVFDDEGELCASENDLRAAVVFFEFLE